MILHDSFFYNVNQSINNTHSRLIVVSYSPLFNSIWTFIICLIGCSTNSICLIKIFQIQKKTSTSNSFDHLRSICKYHSLLILTITTLFLSFLCLISSFDERFFSQTFIARFHLCSIFVFLLKFILHFFPLLIIFILFRYHYFCYRRFRLKRLQMTTSSQILCTDLSWIIPFLLAFAWSIDALWLWGETNRNDFALSTHIDDESIESNDFICYLQINHNLNFTSRLLYFVEIDYFLLFILHLFGFILEIILVLRLSCLTITRQLNKKVFFEQQMAFYILYLLVWLTITSLPFYFSRTCEILFDLQCSFIHHEFINSSTLAQVLLIGISFQPILCVILFIPSHYLIRWKSYTFIHLIPQANRRIRHAQ